MSKIEGKGIYKVLVGNRIETYDNWKKIPMSFKNMIMFKPDILHLPDVEEGHECSESCAHGLANRTFLEIMKRETN